MCGFTAVLRSPATEASPFVCEERLAHCGPDDRGAYADRWISLSFTRLAIVDPTPAGAHPMLSGDGRYCIVFNGEIYNDQELRHQLAHAGVAVRSRSDTEVLVEGFARDGLAVVERLRGMYAFVIW